MFSGIAYRRRATNAGVAFVCYDKAAPQGVKQLLTDYAGKNVEHGLTTATPWTQEQNAGVCPWREATDIGEVQIEGNEKTFLSAHSLPDNLIAFA